MKKTYINPVMETVQIATQQMLAASTNVAFGESVTTTEGACGREDDSDWDD